LDPKAKNITGSPSPTTITMEPVVGTLVTTPEDYWKLYLGEPTDLTSLYFLREGWGSQAFARNEIGYELPRFTLAQLLTDQSE
jgi:hypothetical protein